MSEKTPTAMPMFPVGIAGQPVATDRALLPKSSRGIGAAESNAKTLGRPIADRRKVMAGILYVLRTGCQWNALPKATYGSARRPISTSNGGPGGVFKRMWQEGLNRV